MNNSCDDDGDGGDDDDDDDDDDGYKLYVCSETNYSGAFFFLFLKFCNNFFTSVDVHLHSLVLSPKLTCLDALST